MEKEIKEGQTYKHFKGNMIKIICVAKDTETLKDVIIYIHLKDNGIWARPKEMFLSEVDHDKYPDIQQKYRFELI